MGYVPDKEWILGHSCASCSRGLGDRRGMCCSKITIVGPRPPLKIATLRAGWCQPDPVALMIPAHDLCPVCLFFIEVGSRCGHLAGCTASPTAAWVVQQRMECFYSSQRDAMSAIDGLPRR